LLSLSPQSPELNLIENVRQFLRQNKLSHRIFSTYEAIAQTAYGNWNTIVGDPARITSMGTRQWAVIARGSERSVSSWCK
jgi:hypothetical protein